MMLGERHRPNPTVHVPPWSSFDDPTADDYSRGPLSGVSVNYNGNENSFQLQEALTAFQRYLPSNDPNIDSDSEVLGLDVDSPVDAYSCDHFRMFEFKVRRCVRGRSHDWTECPYAHPGEKARRRDPRKYHYSGVACPDFRKGSCRKGDACEFAHGVFECWLHPARYRTQPCKDGTSCQRRVCFFAHRPEQLRVLPQQSPRSVITADSYDGSPLRQAIEASCSKSLPFVSSPMSISPPSTPPTGSPPLSPMTHPRSFPLGSHSMNEMMASLRNLQLAKAKSFPSSYNPQVGGTGFASPRGSILRPGFFSLPATPTTGPPSRNGIGYRDFLEEGCEEEPTMERVESGKSLRAKMFEKLSKENSLELFDRETSSSAPDVGCVSELVNLN